MSKADLLGAGRSFQRARPVSARRAAIDAATVAPTEGLDAPTELSPHLISLNPDNPRSELGDLTDLGNSLRDHGQKTAISIMSRFAYVEANPGREAELDPNTRYVVIDGNSRLAAAREAGVATVRVMLDDNLGSNPDQILESALVANIHRKDLDPLDEAKALQQLLQLHGTQQALAARLHRSQGWVAQRLALLNLTPELQQRLADGSESVELLRRVGNQKPENQQKKLEELKQKKEEESAAKAAAKAARKAAPAPERSSSAPATKAKGGSGQQSHEREPGADGGEVHYGVMKSDPDAGSSTGLPVPRPAAEVASRAGSSASEAELRTPSGAAMEEALVLQELPDVQRSLTLHQYVHTMASTGNLTTLAEDFSRGLDERHRAGLADILRTVADMVAPPALP
ncbi:ParB/RepB/Spo0J family partition protein [Streptomyces sp. NPDC059071]|uniref:ParB/RepB/Spo0J family partition protein n=1 Tax=unclassified Streptomyces TaxID=2593676 RepID=UPI0036521434